MNYNSQVMSLENTSINPSKIEDCSEILSLIKELAIYEKEPNAVKNTESGLQKTLFCNHPNVFSLSVKQDQKIIGFALYFFTYSTWTGNKTLYLEDFYLQEKYRQSGIGQLVFNKLKTIANTHNCKRLELSVLKWNEPALNFYKKNQMKEQSEWASFRLEL